MEQNLVILIQKLFLINIIISTFFLENYLLKRLYIYL